jgi:hypothetical protein
VSDRPLSLCERPVKKNNAKVADFAASGLNHEIRERSKKPAGGTSRVREPVSVLHGTKEKAQGRQKPE